MKCGVINGLCVVTSCLKSDNENSAADLVIGIANFWPDALQANEILPVPERLDAR